MRKIVITAIALMICCGFLFAEEMGNKCRRVDRTDARFIGTYQVLFVEHYEDRTGISDLTSLNYRIVIGEKGSISLYDKQRNNFAYVESCKGPDGKPFNALVLDTGGAWVISASNRGHNIYLIQKLNSQDKEFGRMSLLKLD